MLRRTVARKVSASACSRRWRSSTNSVRAAASSARTPSSAWTSWVQRTCRAWCSAAVTPTATTTCRLTPSSSCLPDRRRAVRPPLAHRGADQVDGTTWSASAVGRPRGQAGDELQPSGPPTHAPPLPRRLGMDTPIPHGDGQRYALAVEHAWTATRSRGLRRSPQQHTHRRGVQWYCTV